MLKHILHVSNFNANLVRTFMEAIPDDKMCVQPAGLPNHPAWQVGHLALVRSMVAKQAAAFDAGYPEAWSPLFGRGSTPLADRAAYPSKADLMATYNRGHEAAIKAVSALTPAQLEGTHTLERLKPFLPTLGDLITQMLIGHDGLHLGQLGDWRRAMGFPRVI